jgi:hypothetical protein
VAEVQSLRVPLVICADDTDVVVFVAVGLGALELYFVAHVSRWDGAPDTSTSSSTSTTTSARVGAYAEQHGSQQCKQRLHFGDPPLSVGRFASSPIVASIRIDRDRSVKNTSVSKRDSCCEFVCDCRDVFRAGGPVGESETFCRAGGWFAGSALDSSGTLCEGLSRPDIQNMDRGLLSMIGRDGSVVMGCRGGSKASGKGAWSKRESAEWETLLCLAVSVCEDVLWLQGERMCSVSVAWLYRW